MASFFKESVMSDRGADETVGIENSGVIEFSQYVLHETVTSTTLRKIIIKYNGLCEIICNYILLEDLLGEKNLLPLQEDVQADWLNTEPGLEQLGMKFKENTNFVMDNRNKYGDEITLANLRKVENTHILNVINFFTRLIVVLFSIYPCNLFSNYPFAKLPYRRTKLPDGTTETYVERFMLAERLNQLPVGFYIKFFAFKRKALSMEGHSMLIKKMNADKYSFFDPDYGEYLNLNIDELVGKINNSTKEFSANKMVFLDAKNFVNSYKIEKKEVNDEGLSSSPQM